MDWAENWLLVQCGTRYHLMFRDDTSLYLAEIGRYRSRKLERQLSGKPISRESVEKLGLNCQEMPLDSLRGAALGGIERGDPIYLYPVCGNRRTIFLAEEITLEWLDGFFCDLSRFDPPMDKRKRKRDPDFWRKEGQNPELKRMLKGTPWFLSAVGAGCAAGYLYYGTAFWFFCCIACLILPLVLVITMPAYFTFMEKPKKKQKKYGINLSAPILLVWFLMMPTVFNYNAREQWKVFAFSGILTMAVGLVLALFAEEFRRDKWNLWILLLVFLFGAGTVCAANETLDAREPEIQYVQVQELEHRRRTRGADSFYCTVTLSDGAEEKLQVYGTVYRMLEEGDTVILALYPGGLGIAYQQILPIP